MADLFGPQSRLVWTLILAVLLFLPVRQLIWVLSVRRAERRDGPSDEPKRQVLKRRANFTAILLCFIFAYFYTGTVIMGR